MLARSIDTISTHTTPPGLERRAHKRSRAEQLRLTFLGADHLPINWSESGALIEDRHPDLEVGTVVDGVLIFGPHSLRYRFSAEVVRRDAKHIAIQFVNLSSSLRDALTNANS